jgi:hypothetical protein
VAGEIAFGWDAAPEDCKLTVLCQHGHLLSGTVSGCADATRDF